MTTKDDKPIKFQIAITNPETGETTISGGELGGLELGLKFETIGIIDDIEIFEGDYNSQVSVMGEDLITMKELFLSIYHTFFLPGEEFEKQQILEMYSVGDILKIRAEYYFAYGITFFVDPDIAPVVSKLKDLAEKLFDKDERIETPDNTKQEN